MSRTNNQNCLHFLTSNLKLNSSYKQKQQRERQGEKDLPLSATESEQEGAAV